jgi:hypothetical protein
MNSSVFVFGTDLLHEGHDTVLGTLQERGCVDDVALSANYHNARDVFPHNPRYRIYRHEGDIAWFIPDKAAYKSGLIPQISSDMVNSDMLAELCEHAHRRSMGVTAWTIFLHNSRLASRNPDCATRNVYGDPYLTDLCPANPRVRSYCRELAADISRFPVQRLFAESLHYRPLEHGEHHERYLIDIPKEARTLLSLCFCRHCRQSAIEAGVAIDELADAVRRALEPVWSDTGAGTAAEPILPPDAQAELEAFVTVREKVVASLVGEVREAMRTGGPTLGFMDHGGAMSKVMHGTDADEDVLLLSRKLGIDVPSVMAECDELCVLGYTDTPERLATMLKRYNDVVGTNIPITVALRPLLPDCHSEANLRAKMAAVRAAGLDRVVFYHYAMMPLPRLDWIRRAIPEKRG